MSRYKIYGCIPEHPNKNKQGWFLLPVSIRNEQHAKDIISNLNVKFPSHRYRISKFVPEKELAQ